MTRVYVDPLHPCVKSRKWPYTQSCHLVADSLDALHELAGRIGLKRSYFQDHPLLPHYDLTPGKRKEAIAAGAEAISFTRLNGLIQTRKTDRVNGDTYGRKTAA